MLENELNMDECRIDRKSLSETMLRWWGTNKLIYSTLYRVACAYLAVPAKSATSERVLPATPLALL